jgi:hypothetical protein
LQTDFSASPQIQLQLFVEGCRIPPYLFQFAGDLYYPEGYSADDVRNVTVDTIEPKGTPEVPPRLTSDLPFLRFEPPTVSERPFLTDATLIVRTYRFPVKFASPPPAERFDGEISVLDSWVAGRVLRCKVHGDANLPIRAAPSHLILTVGGPADTRSRARFLARATKDRAPLRAEAEGSESSSLIVEAVEQAREDESTTFEMRWKPGRPVT